MGTLVNDASELDGLAKDAAKAGERVGLKADSIVIRGGKPLNGRVDVRGAKNALRDQPVVQTQLALADTALRAARSFLLQSLREVQDGIRETGAMTTDQRMTIRAAGTNAIHRGTEVVETLYRAAGANAIFENEPFERRFRDAYSVSQHLQGRLAHFEQVGKHLLGEQTDLMFV